jgi:hypothetical protein
MKCQRCGKACANRAEGRRIRLAGKDLFLCNVCSARAVAGGGGGERGPVRRAPGAAPQPGGLAAPLSGR